MSLEQQISLLPKTLLAVIVIGAAVILMFLFNPPHTLCDTQVENVQNNLAGVLFAEKINKNTIQPRIRQAQSDCRMGNSAGACYEFFGHIKTVLRHINQAAPECRAQVLSGSEVSSALKGAVETMALLAWGLQPPQTSAQRFGWLQESELALFCQLKETYSQVNGESAWNSLRLQINGKYPGEKAATSTEGDRPKAKDSMGPDEIWSKSIFSIRCEGIH